MRTALRGLPCRRGVDSSDKRLISQALSRLTTTTTTTTAQPSSPPWTCPTCSLNPKVTLRSASTSSSPSSSQWKSRQTNDPFARGAKLQGLKSRAAFKLLEMDSKYKLFRRNQTIVDLGYAPGSWSQVAVERTLPHGVVVGIDLIPAQPPHGVTSIQGDFLSPAVRALVRDVLREQVRRRRKKRAAEEGVVDLEDRPSYIDAEKQASRDIEAAEAAAGGGRDGRLVDVVISDMSEPWAQVTGFSSRTLSLPYYRLMNTSGINFKDHAGSMDLCYAALRFAFDNLKDDGHFICKYYAGGEDGKLEKALKKMFSKVHREKPDASRKDSKEGFFVALKRKKNVAFDSVDWRE